MAKAVLGLDFGTESVRALLASLDGESLAASVVRYPHGQIVSELPGTEEPLPPHFALQHPDDWLSASRKAVRKSMKEAGLDPEDVIGVGVDFTSCTMLPAKADGSPLCLDPAFAGEKYAWPKLWKHHGAGAQTDRINWLAQEQQEPWLARYGGLVGLEWFFPKLLETIENAPGVAAATDVWLEGGDWFVWQLVGGQASTLPRSTCQAGYKACWNARDGYPNGEFLRSLHPDLAEAAKRRMPGRMLSPGQAAGELTEAQAKQFGLRPGTPVSAAVIDAHAAVPGVGAGEPGTLVMVLGTSSCHMLNAVEEKLVPGVAGVVRGGILPGLFGYETGQAAVGDAFDWLRRMTGEKGFARLDEEAAKLPAGSDGVACLDWFNGCRTPLMDGTLRGAFVGLAMHHTPAHLYRAAIEATGYGLRWIVDLLRSGGVPATKFVATGGLPHHNPLIVQLYADVLAEPIDVHPSPHASALGAAILGAAAAGEKASGFSSVASAVHAMSGSAAGIRTVSPRAEYRDAYRKLYRRYRSLESVGRA